MCIRDRYERVVESADAGLGVVERGEAIVSERHGLIEQRQAGVDELDTRRDPVQPAVEFPPRLVQPCRRRGEPVKTRLDDVIHS